MTYRLRVLPRFPANISGSVGITVEREGVDLVIKPDYGALTQVPAVIDPDANFFTVWNEDDDMYVRMSFGDVFGAVSGLGFMQTEVYDPQEIGGDAFARANHTGAQAISTITGLQTALDAKEALLTGATSDSTFSASDEIIYLTGSTTKRGTVTGLFASIPDGSVGTADLADLAVTEAKIAAAAVAKFTSTRATKISAASQTSMDFTSIPSGVKKITIALAGLSTNGTSPIIVQIGDSGGVETTGYLGASSNVAASVSSVNYTNGFGLHASVIATNVYHGNITLVNIDGNEWVASGVVGRSDGASTAQLAGSKSLSDVLDRVRITTSGGTDTFDAGSVNIIYEY